MMTERICCLTKEAGLAGLETCSSNRRIASVVMLGYCIDSGPWGIRAVLLYNFLTVS